jgi:Fructose-2,6-bisphosphatase
VGDWIDDFDDFAEQQWADFTFHLANGESLQEVAHRMSQVLNQILEETKGSIIICGHGTSLAVLFHQLLHGRFSITHFKQMTMPDVYCATVDSQLITKFERV